jgi:hypothetical protein
MCAYSGRGEGNASSQLLLDHLAHEVVGNSESRSYVAFPVGHEGVQRTSNVGLNFDKFYRRSSYFHDQVTSVVENQLNINVISCFSNDSQIVIVIVMLSKIDSNSSKLLVGETTCWDKNLITLW